MNSEQQLDLFSDLSSPLGNHLNIWYRSKNKEYPDLECCITCRYNDGRIQFWVTNGHWEGWLDIYSRYFI